MIVMSKREQNELKQNELIGDLIAFRSILYKMGFDESADNEKLFVEMANEAGFRSVHGHGLTYMGVRQMFKRGDQEYIRNCITKMCNDPIVINFEV